MHAIKGNNIDDENLQFGKQKMPKMQQIIKYDAFMT